MSPGQTVVEGQPLARVGVQTKGSTMVHFETYGVEGVSDEGLVAAIRKLVEPRPSTPSLPPAELDVWEREALARGEVGDPEGAHTLVVDQAPVSRGEPREHCVVLGADGGQLAPHCVVDPLSDPRFAPIDRGAPQSAIPSSSTWPVLTKHSGRLVVSYWTQAGVRGYSGRAFGAPRTTSNKGEPEPRKHAGVDLFAREGDVVVAPEDATILRILPFNAGTWAVYLRSTLGDRVVNLGEVRKLSWREFGVSPGQTVVEGQPLARVGVQTKGSTMLHFETYGVEGVSDEDLVAAIRARAMSWSASKPAPTWLWDPSGYLLVAATRTYRRERLWEGESS